VAGGPRRRVPVGGVHRAAEHGDRVEVAERAGHRLAGARCPLDELVAARRDAGAEHAAVAAAGVQDAQDPHPAAVWQGCEARMGDGERILITGVLLALGLLASLAAGRLRLPGLVLVLGLGMLLGSDGLGLL